MAFFLRKQLKCILVCYTKNILLLIRTFQLYQLQSLCCYGRGHRRFENMKKAWSSPAMTFAVHYVSGATYKIMKKVDKKDEFLDIWNKTSTHF